MKLASELNSIPFSISARNRTYVNHLFEFIAEEIYKKNIEKSNTEGDPPTPEAPIGSPETTSYTIIQQENNTQPTEIQDGNPF